MSEYIPTEADSEHMARMDRAKFSDDALERQLPNSPEAEQGALGCVFVLAQNTEARIEVVQSEIDTLLTQMSFSFFFDLRNRNIYAELMALREQKRALDLILFLDWLNHRKKKEDCGGWPYVSSLSDKVPSAANFRYYLEILQEKSVLREHVRRSRLIIERVYSEGTAEEITSIIDTSLENAPRLAAKVPLIDIITPATAREFEPDPNDLLIGEGLISCQNIVTIGGEPGIGKRGGGGRILSLSVKFSFRRCVDR